MVTHYPVKLTAKPRGNHLVTDEILSKLDLPEVGLLHLFIQHTSASLTVNENASPEVRTDLNNSLDRMVPENPSLYQHTEEGPDDMPAHIKAVLCGNAISIPVQNGKAMLGQWQGIYLMEFRNNAGPRNIIATLIS